MTKEATRVSDQLQGVWTTFPTPLTENEGLDEKSTRRIAKFLAGAGVHGIWLLGSGGEGALLPDSARVREVEAVLDEVGSIPVFVGISAEGTRRVLERYEALADLPFFGVFATPPIYYECTQSQLFDFYSTLATEIQRPLIIYNNPIAGRALVEAATLVELANHQHIVGVKETSGDFTVTQSVLIHTRALPDFCVFQGFDNLAAASILAGADGVVSSVSAFAPRLVLELNEAAHARDAERAFTLQNEVIQLIAQLGWDETSESAFIRGMKTCLEALGLSTARVASPYTQASREEIQKARDAVMAAPQLAALTR
jgi:dihydrodipicolinate synthase/N-acetylneuraminate lyase